jgi:peroxiredoxin Q/BCP
MERKMTMELKKGDLAPEFKLQDQDGNWHRLADYKGKKLVLYFYPRDNTPGCTKEACNFRDNIASFNRGNTVVIGVSGDSVSSHAKFHKKYELPFTLLADPEHSMLEAYGVWQEKTFMGKKHMGIVRTTFILDEDGKILEIYKKVKPEVHAHEIIKLLGL